MASTRKQLEALIAREAQASMEKMILEQADQKTNSDKVAHEKDAHSNMEAKASESTEAEKLAEEDIELERSAMVQSNPQLSSHAQAVAVGTATVEPVETAASADASKAATEKEATPLKTFAEQPNTVEVVDDTKSCCMPWRSKAKAPQRTVGQAA